MRRNPRFHLRAALTGSLLTSMAASTTAGAVTLSNGTFSVQTGTYGEISSLQIVSDSFPTNYVLNAANAAGQDTADHQWLGELMFAYKLGSATTWTTALTNQSGDVRKVTSNATSVTVTYQNSAGAEGIRNFKLVETYSLVNDHIDWQIALTNTSTQSIELGDIGLPLPFNEMWTAGDVIYEQRTVYHSFVGNNSSFIDLTRAPNASTVVVVITNVTMDGYQSAQSYGWDPNETFGYKIQVTGGGPAPTDVTYF